MEIWKSVPVHQLVYAAEINSRTVRNTDTVKVLQGVQKSTTRAAKVCEAVLVPQQMTTTKKHTPEESLRIFLKASITKAQYDVIQKTNKEVYPCYTLLQN